MSHDNLYCSKSKHLYLHLIVNELYAVYIRNIMDKNMYRKLLNTMWASLPMPKYSVPINRLIIKWIATRDMVNDGSRHNSRNERAISMTS